MLQGVIAADSDELRIPPLLRSFNHHGGLWWLPGRGRTRQHLVPTTPGSARRDEALPHPLERRSPVYRQLRLLAALTGILDFAGFAIERNDTVAWVAGIGGLAAAVLLISNQPATTAAAPVAAQTTLESSSADSGSA